MSRFLFITLANILLPFVLHWAWTVFKNWKFKPENKQTWSPPWRKLLLAGVCLLLLSLGLLRFFSYERDSTWQTPNTAASRTY